MAEAHADASDDGEYTFHEADFQCAVGSQYPVPAEYIKPSKYPGSKEVFFDVEKAHRDIPAFVDAMKLARITQRARSTLQPESKAYYNDIVTPAYSMLEKSKGKKWDTTKNE
jgi:hypothetical protein